MPAQFQRSGVVRPNRLVDPEGGAWDAYVRIDDADALHAELKAKGRHDIEGPRTHRG